MAQRAIININGDLIPFSEDLDRIRTPGLGGSAVTWVPDADTICDQLKVTANGTYSAAEAGKYGYDYVVVSVPGSSVTGRDPDTGEEVEVHPDPETGEIVTTVLPTEIRVITPPTKTVYADGETITKDGMVVKAYSATGAELQTVPIGEITINPTTAVYDESTDTGGGGTGTINGDYPWMAGYPSSITAFGKSYCTYNNTQREASGQGAMVVGIPTDTSSGLLWLSKSQATVEVKTIYSDGQTEVRDYTLTDSKVTRISGTRFYYRYGLGTLGSTEEQLLPSPENLPILFDTDIVATILFDGTFTPQQPGSIQTITVSWPRPGDGAVLETSFSINVTGGST